MTQRFVVLLTASLLLCISLSGLAQDAKSAPDNPDPVAADQLYKAGKFAEAAEKYQALLKTDAKLVAAEAGLIEALLREQKIDEALRITYIGKRTVTFWYKDKRLRRLAFVQCSLEEFIDRWAQHIPERYQHAVRGFGLFAPRALKQTSAAIFAILGQERRPRPKPRRWADSLKRDFGRDPLLDQTGKRMKWVRRQAPETSR